jgi:hypothetical protein
MSAPETSRLRRVSEAEHALATAQQAAEERAGGPRRSIDAILAGRRQANVTAPADLAGRQLRRRGRYGQAALLADQAALEERDADRANKARLASGMLKLLAERRPQLEFNFFGGNVSVGHEYFDAIFARLKTSGVSGVQQRTALATLGVITRYLGWQTYECTKTAAELADMLTMDAAHVTRTLQLLERVGAISRIKRGRTRVIAITPEGVYRGDMNRHAEAVDRYKSEVVPLRPRSPESTR